MDKIFIAFGSLIFGIIIGVQISYLASDHPSNLEKFGYETLIGSGRYIKSIDYNNHSYIYLRNSWNSAGDQFIHNPDCECYINRENYEKRKM